MMLLVCMAFSKICSLCNHEFTSLENYMSHIKNNHEKVSPEEFVRQHGELKWSFRNAE